MLKNTILGLMAAVALVTAFNQPIQADAGRGFFGGALTGAAIGGIAGGGRGALIGTAVGGTLGAAVGAAQDREYYDDYGPYGYYEEPYGYYNEPYGYEDAEYYY